ncbi:MAG: hypothetical protein GY918_07190 [Gammaproteobacteria bacterium]|nr:hypothetical protein [Gammaproteobacteria bacterium]
MGFFSRLTGAEQQGNAARRANRATQEAIQQSRDEINAAFPQIQNLYNQGNDAQMGYMRDIAGNYSGLAGMLNPALESLQSTGTASGRAEEMINILNDPNQQRLRNLVAKNATESNRALGLGRSGYGIGMSQQAELGLANNLLNQQDQQQQLMAGYGMSGNDNLSRIQMGMGQLAGDRYNNQANLDMKRLNMINNLTAQSGQSNAASYLAQGNAAAAGMGSLLSLGGTLGGAYLGRPA